MRRSLSLLLLALIGLLVPAKTALAWKPSTHVYLALLALDEITSTTDLLGNAKEADEVVFYHVDHHSGRILERIGSYEARTDLVDALKAHRRAFVMGTVGPDAYPDIATGQQRIHVRHPVHSDRWLQYLWDQAQGKDPMIMAFVLGYLAHAVGDMFMHTYVNHFAGGPFSVDVDRAAGNPLNFNAARHVIFESYVGRRTPPLEASDYELGEEVPEPLREFVYRHLADARTVEHPQLSPRSDTYFGRNVMVSKPYLNADNFDFESSVPRYFSDLRDGLVSFLNTVDDTVSAVDRRIQNIFDDAAEQSCPVNVRCDSPPEQQNAACVTACAAAAVLTAPHVAYKTAFLAVNGPPYTYVKEEWVPNIDSGLREWIDLNHEIARHLIFAEESDLGAVRDSASFYADVHLPGMLGLPSAVGEYAAFSQSIKEMVFGDLQDAVDELRSNLLNFLFERAFGVTVEDFQDMTVSSHARFNTVLPLEYTGEEGENAREISLAEFNAVLGIEDPEYQFPERTWDPLAFPPAWNTITLIKMTVLSESGLEELLTDLGVDCTGGRCRTDENVALGYMRSLDESLQWLPDNPSDPKDDPAFAAYKSPLPGFALEECGPYARLFMRQEGDVTNPFSAGGRAIESRPCPPVIPLEPPVITPDGGAFGAPVTVTITPPADLPADQLEELEIYYTMQIAGNTVDPLKPEPNRVDSRIHPYTGPFTVAPPLDPDQLPITVRARAYHPDYLQSEQAVAAFDVDARLETPVLSRTSGEYLEPFSVTVTLPNDPGGSGIYYTLTGEDPDYNDEPYTGPLQLSRGQHDLRVVAYRPGYVRSEVARAEYRIFAPNEVERAEVPYFTAPRGSGTYTGNVTVAIETDTQDGIIRWTAGQDQLPAFDPTATLGNAYSGPFQLPKGNWFIRAITVKDGLFDSEIAQININIVDPLGTISAPVVSPPGGIFNNDVEVRLAGAVHFVNSEGQAVTDSNGIQIQYTLDGTEPDINPNFNPLSNRRYLAPFKLNRSSTLRALGTRIFFPISDVTEVDFRFVAAPPEAEPAPGVFYDSVRVSLASETENATIRYTLDGSEPTEVSERYAEPFLLTSSAAVRARAFRSGYEFSDVADASYVVETSTPPVIARQPRSVHVVRGRDATITVLAAGDPEPAFQWFFEGGAIDGAIDDTLWIEAVDESDAGTYSVSISNASGTVTSESVQLSLVPEPVAPAITLDLPEILEVQAGQAVSFGITAEGTPEPSFIWYRNGSPLAAQAGSSISYGAADLAQAGTYRVVALNSAGADSSAEMQLVILLATNVSSESADELPESFELGQNYPNPFNPTTAIPFALPEQARVRIEIFDVTGRRIGVLVDREFAAGRYTARFDAEGLASGMYLYRMEAGQWSEVRKLVLVR